MEVPEPGIEFELTYATAAAIPDPFNSLCWARNRTCIYTKTWAAAFGFLTHCAMVGTQSFFFFFSLCPGHTEVPRPGIEPTQQQWQYQILSHQAPREVPIILILYLSKWKIHEGEGSLGVGSVSIRLIFCTAETTLHIWRVFGSLQGAVTLFFEIFGKWAEGQHLRWKGMFLTQVLAQDVDLCGCVKGNLIRF